MNVTKELHTSCAEKSPLNKNYEENHFDEEIGNESLTFFFFIIQTILLCFSFLNSGYEIGFNFDNFTYMANHIINSVEMTKKEKIGFIKSSIDMMRKRFSDLFPTGFTTAFMETQQIPKKWFFDENNNFREYLVCSSEDSGEFTIHCVYCIAFANKQKHNLCNVGLSFGNTKKKRFEQYISGHEKSAYHLKSKSIFTSFSESRPGEVDVDSRKIFVENNRYIAQKIIQIILYLTTAGKHLFSSVIENFCQMNLKMSSKY